MPRMGLLLEHVRVPDAALTKSGNFQYAYRLRGTERFFESDSLIALGAELGALVICLFGLFMLGWYVWEAGGALRLASWRVYGVLSPIGPWWGMLGLFCSIYVVVGVFVIRSRQKTEEHLRVLLEGNARKV